MSFSTYADLQTSVQSFLHRSDMDSIIPDLIKLGELRIFREVRCRVMESTLNGTIANGVIALPSDYLDLKFAYIDATPAVKLARSSASQIYEHYPYRTASGMPCAIAREGDNFIFGPYPDSGYTVKGIYYAQPESIVNSANALYLESPDLYLFAALAESAPYTQDDPRVQLWEGKYASSKQQVSWRDTEEYGSGAGMAVRVR